jgi:hypothetical protein
MKLTRWYCSQVHLCAVHPLLLQTPGNGYVEWVQRGQQHGNEHEDHPPCDVHADHGHVSGEREKREREREKGGEREGGREREREREGRREGGREREREGERERGREGEREGGREGEREGGRENHSSSA